MRTTTTTTRTAIRIIILYCWNFPWNVKLCILWQIHISTPANDVCARYDLKNHPVNIITSSDLELFHNKLTVDKHNVQQRWRAVEYPALGTGNTTKHDGQTYLIINDGTLFGHLDHQSTKNKQPLSLVPLIWLNGRPRNGLNSTRRWKRLELSIKCGYFPTIAKDNTDPANVDSFVQITMIMLMRISPINTNPKLRVGVYKSWPTSGNSFQRR